MTRPDAAYCGWQRACLVSLEGLVSVGKTEQQVKKSRQELDNGAWRTYSEKEVVCCR